MKRKLFCLYLLCVLTLAATAHPVAATSDRKRYPGGKCVMYRLYLKDKDLNHSPFSLSKPEVFLSDRAIERRKRQGLELDKTDLPIAPAYLEAVRQKGLEVVAQSKWNNTLVVRIRKEKELKLLEDLDFIVKKQKVFQSPDSINTHLPFKPQSDYSACQRHQSEYGATQAQVEAMKGDLLHHAGFKGKGMLIAIFDGGFMNANLLPALRDLKLMGTKDFVVPHSEDIFSEMEHGTKVLSIMAAQAPHYYLGVATDAQYLLIRSEDEHSESLVEEDYWAAAAEYADSCGVDVINSSLGYHDFDDSAMNHHYADQDGETTLISHTASLLADKGIICVNSAGNDGMGSWKKINFPADAKDILTVGSIEESGINASFSAVGPTADGRIKPDVMAWGSPTAIVMGSGMVVNDNGTSFSAPLVAGMVACLWQALPNKTARQIIKLVKQSGNSQQHPDNVYGYGVPDFWKAYQTGKSL